MFWGLAIIFVGLILLLEELEIVKGGLSDFWPVLLVALGMAMVANWCEEAG